MNLDELRKKRESIDKQVETIIFDMESSVSEIERVALVASNAQDIINDLENEFENITSLKACDVPFLMLCTALQFLRIEILNRITKIELAGEGELEKLLHTKQEDFFYAEINGKRIYEPVTNRYTGKYYAPLNQIISTMDVPYDAMHFKHSFKKQGVVEEIIDFSRFNVGQMKGGNHRFSTLGHDPILGLIFGTANILTNTITFQYFTLPQMALYERGVPIEDITKKGLRRNIKKYITPSLFLTNHVWYKVDTNDPIYKYTVPLIAYPASTAKMLNKALERSIDSTSAFTAALIKQIIHTGTDAFTELGIALPGSTIINSTSDIESITKYVSQDSFNFNTGDAVKAGAGYITANFINMIISVLHKLCNIEDNNSKLYEVRTRKIILYSNEIATGSNVLKSTWELINGNAMGLHNLDLGGILLICRLLTENKAFINEVKKEFVLNGFLNKIDGV